MAADPAERLRLVHDHIVSETAKLPKNPGPNGGAIVAPDPTPPSAPPAPIPGVPSGVRTTVPPEGPSTPAQFIREQHRRHMPYRLGGDYDDAA